MDPAIHALINIEAITDKILSFFPLVDLLNASSVCQSWRRAAERILSRRSRFSSVDGACRCIWNRPHQHSFSSSIESKRIKLSSSSDYQLDNVKAYFLDWKKRWQQAPQMIIVLCKMPHGGKNNKELSNKVFKLLHEYFPQSCISIMLRGLTYFSHYSKRTSVIKMEAVSILPSHSNSIDVFTWTSLKTKRSRKDFLVAIKDFLLNQNDLKFFLFFFDVSKSDVAHWIHDSLIYSLRNDFKLNDDVVVLGCAVRGFSRIFHSGCRDNNDLQFLAVKICGNSVSSASVLADATVKTISQLSTKVQYLRETFSRSLLTSYNSVGIIVSCVDRMYYDSWYEDFEESDEHVEVEVFKQKFPGIPCLLMHGFGEVGGNCNLKSSNSNKSDLIFHSHGAFFALVHFKD